MQFPLVLGTLRYNSFLITWLTECLRISFSIICPDFVISSRFSAFRYRYVHNSNMHYARVEGRVIQRLPVSPWVSRRRGNSREFAYYWYFCIAQGQWRVIRAMPLVTDNGYRMPHVRRTFTAFASSYETCQRLMRIIAKRYWKTLRK